MTAKQLTDSELNAIQQEIETLNIRQQKGSVTAKEALDVAYAKRNELKETLDRTVEASPLRKATWKMVNDFIQVEKNVLFEEERSIPVKFPADADLDIEARKAVSDVSRMISKMENTPESEGAVRDALAKLNNYGKYIDTEHKVLKDLRQKYMDKTAANYMEYAKGAFRNVRRDAELSAKIKKNFDDGKYSDAAFVQAILTLLEPRIPQA